MTGEQSNDAADLLYRNLGALRTADLGHINLMPFSQDNPQVNHLKREVCRAVVQLFIDNGYTMDKDVAAPKGASRDIVLRCRSCSTALLHSHVDDNGVANIPAANVIAGMATLSHECPHKPITPEDQRRKIEEAILAAQTDGEV